MDAKKPADRTEPAESNVERPAEREADRLAEAEAEEELRRESEKILEREYQRAAADLRWAALDYVDEHPDEPLADVARRFGLKEGSIRAWKAHVTMGTYQHPGERGRDRLRRGQNSLFAAEAKKKPPFLERPRHSNFIHLFDQTPEGIVCPHFYVLSHANGCPYACHYCYLRLTLRHQPEPTVFSNTARLCQEVKEWLLAEEKPAVLNCGELSDGLAWDRFTELSRALVPLFAGQKKHKLLFLTKTADVKPLLRLEPHPQVVVSFSLNADEAAQRYEKKTPPPAKRLAAARQLRDAGWTVRVRLDPIIPLAGWREQYGATAEAINDLAPQTVTLGTLRFFRQLPEFAPRRTDVFRHGHDLGDPDGRLRVAPQTRLEIYRFLLDKLEAPKIGLCKETLDLHCQLGLPGPRQSCNCTVD